MFLIRYLTLYKIPQVYELKYDLTISITGRKNKKNPENGQEDTIS
jgi:hypothetical protein